MLLKIREKTQSWLAWLIVGLISIPFALFGIESYISTSANITVAMVNDTEILLPDYQREFSNYKSRIRNILGANYNPSITETDITKKTVLDNMITQELTKQYLSDAGFDVGIQKVANEITGIEAFQTDGKFNPEIYKRAVNSRQMNEMDFENQVRLDLIQQQFRMGFDNFSFVSKEALDDIIRLQNHTRKVSLLEIPASKIKVSKRIKPDEIKQFYQRNKRQYIKEESLKVQFVELSAQLLTKKVTVSNEELRAVYQENRNNLLTNELRNFSHIMLLVNKGESEKYHKRRIDKIYKQLKKGANFATLVKQKSEDVGSIESNGQLGYAAKNDLDSTVADVLFDMKKGEISKPVRSKFGYHILKLHNIKTPKIKSFKQAKKELLKTERLKKAQELFAENAEHFSNLSYEKPDSLDPLVDELNLKISTSDWINKTGGNGIFSEPKVLDAIFSDTVIQNKQNSDIVELNNDLFVVFRMLEHRKQRFLTLDESEETIRKVIINNRKNIALNKKGQSLIKALESGESKNSVARKLGLKWRNKTYGLNSNLNPKIKNAIFSMAKPKNNKPTYRKVADKKYTVIALNSVNFAKPDSQSKQEKARNNAIDNIQNELSNFNYSSFINELKSESDITVSYQQILNESVGGGYGNNY